MHKDQTSTCLQYTLTLARPYIHTGTFTSDNSTHTQARAYIADSLGDQYAEGVILDVEKMCIETECRTPLVGLLSMGSDPTASIEQLAKKLKTG